MKNNDLQLGVIGSGGRGGHLAQIAHRPGKGARIVACCDNNPATLTKNREDFGAGVFTTSSIPALLEQKLDAVIIGTPDFLHEEQALAVLKHGLAIYLEKPMALTTAACDRILAAAKKHRARLYVGHNMRHMTFVRKMKDLIDDGVIGDVKACWCRHFVGHGGDFYFRDWHADRRYVNSLLLQKAAHDIDVIHWLCGGYSRTVNALGGLTVYGDLPGRLPPVAGPRRLTRDKQWMKVYPPTKSRGLNHKIDVEDLSSMQMELDNGVFATYAQCHYSPDYWRNYTVIGTEGRLENFGNGEPGTHLKLWNKRASYNANGDKIYKFPVEKGSHGGADPKIMAEFLRYVRHGGKTDTSPLAARESIAAGCAATDSLRAGGVLQKIAAPRADIVKFFERGGA